MWTPWPERTTRVCAKSLGRCDVMSIFGRDLVTKPVPPPTKKEALTTRVLLLVEGKRTRTLSVVETGLMPHVEEVPHIPENIRLFSMRTLHFHPAT